MFAVAVTGVLGDGIIKYINAFAKGFQFLLSGGLSALTGSGSADEALAALKDTPPLVTEENAGLVLGADLRRSSSCSRVLLSGDHVVQRPSVQCWGLLLGLIAGYIVAAMVVRAIAPEYAALVPLPFGVRDAGPDRAHRDRAGRAGTVAWERILAFLNGLVDRGLITAFLGIVIAVFLLVGIRSGRRSSGEKKG